MNGLPLAVLELKNAADEAATIWSAYEQLQTYKAEIPALFAYNEALPAAGSDARSVESNPERAAVPPGAEGQEGTQARHSLRPNRAVMNGPGSGRCRH